MEQELIFSSRNGILHKRPRLTKLTEARKKAGYNSQRKIAKKLKITQTEYCSYESGKKEMPKRIAKRISTLLNMPIDEVTSVDYQNEKLTKDATKVLEKMFKMLGELELWQLDELDKTVTNMSLMNGVMKYRKMLQRNRRKFRKNVKELKEIKINRNDFTLLFSDTIDMKEISNISIHYETMLTLIEYGLLPENQLKDFIKYFNIIK